MALLSTVLLLLLLLPPPPTQAMLYAPPRGSIWDPSCFRIGGQFHCVFMYIGQNQTLNAEFGGYPSGLLATSDDGVNFRTVAPVAYEKWKGVGFFKAFVSYVGPDSSGQPQFVMNHGTEGNTTNRPPPSADDPGCPFASQCMRFLKSSNLLDWEPLYSQHPDPRWYSVGGSSSSSRWDAAMMLQDPDDTTGKEWMAFPTATVPGRVGCGLGMMRSSDGGLTYSPVPPPMVDWGPLGRGTSLEIGGVAKIGDWWFQIGGTSNAGYKSYSHAGAANGYNVYALASKNSTGPYSPRPATFRLSGTSQIPVHREVMHSLGAFVHDYDEGVTLVSNYMGSSNIYLTPFKKPVSDDAGNLRLAWWEGNEALKGEPIKEFPEELIASSHKTAIAWLPSPGPTWNHTTGIVFSGQFMVRAASGGSSIGFAFEAVSPSQWAPTVPAPPANSTRQIMMSVEPVHDPIRQTVISDVVLDHDGQPNTTTVDVSGEFPCGPDGVQCADATKTSVSPDLLHSFIVLARRGMFELYVDGLLVQYYVYGECAFTASSAFYNVSYPYNTTTTTACFGGSCRECGGRIGLVVNGTTATVQFLRGWDMSLSYFPQ